MLTYEQVTQILEQQKNEIEDNKNYQLFWRGYLTPLWDERLNKQACFCLCITEEEIDNMDFTKVSLNIGGIKRAILSSNTIRVDRNGHVFHKEHIEYSPIANARELLCQLSKNSYVFFFGEEGIDRYANGRPLQDQNIFYSRSDRMKYMMKKDISHIEEVISEYSSSYLTQQVNYMSFLADNATIKQMQDGHRYIGRNILKNKPEHYMRDQLRQYLTDHMQYTFTIEPELGQSKRELDIYFDVQGELYFIEIKWLGVSINDSGTGLSTTYGLPRVKEGVIQSLEYIEELTKTSETSLRCGYLAIFDCRDNKTKIDTCDFSFVSEDLNQYLQIFNFLPIINVQKRHPA